MLEANPILTPRLLLRILGDENVTERYLGWLRSEEVTRYMEVRFSSHTEESVRAFIRSINSSSESILFGMFTRDGGLHIGNIKLGPVNPVHARADIGLMLGEKSEWGKGYATEAIRAVTSFGFERLGLRKISAGCYAENVGSLKAFLKAGFTHEATIKDHWETSTGRQDELILGISKPAFERADAAVVVRYGHVDRLTLIGGGDVLVETARAAKELGYQVAVVLAPRHAEEALPIACEQIGTVCRNLGVQVDVTEDINTWPALPTRDGAGKSALALCFGPAWIFKAHVIAQFGAGMINFNGIPIPEYLGGAHYTWQILNRNRAGGCHLQEITEDVDRGDILRRELFELPEGVRLPKDYFAENFKAAAAFMRRALADFKSDQPFRRAPYALLDAKRLYFPRLDTKANGWLDWQWSGIDIEIFCNAFDDPYMGAGTFWNGQEVRIRGVGFESAPARHFHPYVAGLVVRRHADRLYIAVSGGLLVTDSVRTPEGALVSRIREGDRFATPADTLLNARAFRLRIDGRAVAEQKRQLKRT